MTHGRPMERGPPLNTPLKRIFWRRCGNPRTHGRSQYSHQLIHSFTIILISSSTNWLITSYLIYKFTNLLIQSFIHFTHEGCVSPYRHKHICLCVGTCIRSINVYACVCVLQIPKVVCAHVCIHLYNNRITPILVKAYWQEKYVHMHELQFGMCTCLKKKPFHGCRD